MSVSSLKIHAPARMIHLHGYMRLWKKVLCQDYDKLLQWTIVQFLNWKRSWAPNAIDSRIMNVWESNWCSSRIWKNCFSWWMFSSIFIAYSTLGLLRWDFFQRCQINWKWLAIYLEGKYPWLELDLNESRDTENKYQDVLLTAIS